MENRLVPSGRSENVDYANGKQWQDTIQLLRLVQSDYQGLRRQVQQVGNNLAERDLRSIVLWRKRSFGTRSESGQRYVERISSVLLTMRKRFHPPLSVLFTAFQEHYS